MYRSESVKSKCILEVVDCPLHVPDVSYNVINLCDSIVKREGVLDDTVAWQVGSL